MEIIFETTGNSEEVVQLPHTTHKGYLRKVSSAGLFGEIFFKRKKVKGITFWEHRYKPRKVAAMRWVYKHTFLGLHASLTSPVVVNAMELPEMLLKTRECIISYLKDIIATFIHLPETGSRSIHIIYPLHFFKTLSAYYPFFKILRQHAEQGTSYICSDKSVFIDHKVMRVIDEILDEENDEEMQSEYLHFKAVELLFIVGKELMKRDKLFAKQGIDEEDLKKMMAVTTYIKENLQEKHTIGILSKMVRMDAIKLTTLFKQANGITLRQFILEARLHEGYRLVTTTDKCIADIALTVGFANSSHFSSMFKRYYRRMPKELRAKKNN